MSAGKRVMCEAQQHESRKGKTMARTTEHTFTTEAQANTHRRANINAGRAVSLIGYDSDRDVYAYDVYAYDDQDQDQDQDRPNAIERN